MPSGRCYSEDVQNSDLLCLGSDRETPINDFAATQNQQRYLLQLMYVDHLIGQLPSRLTETGILDRCLLIVSADHGVSFRAQQPRRSLAAGNQDEILSIPLFIKRPRQTSGEISDPFGGPLEGYQKCAQQLDKHTDYWIDRLDTECLIQWK